MDDSDVMPINISLAAMQASVLLTSLLDFCRLDKTGAVGHIITNMCPCLLTQVSMHSCGLTLIATNTFCGNDCPHWGVQKLGAECLTRLSYAAEYSLQTVNKLLTPMTADHNMAADVADMLLKVSSPRQLHHGLDSKPVSAGLARSLMFASACLVSLCCVQLCLCCS